MKFICVAAILLAGCASPVVHNTASGKPERLFSSPPDQVRAALITELVNRHYSITQETQSLIVGEKVTKEVGVTLAYGTGFGPPTVRSSFTMIPNPPGTRVVGDIVLIQNAGTGFQRIFPMDDSAGSNEMQAALNAIPLP